MFDKITIRSSVSNDDCNFLAKHHKLHTWINPEETQVEYRSGENSKISGIEITIKKNKLKLTTSLHKYWNKRNYGMLRNDNSFTVSEAKSAFQMLLYENRLCSGDVRIIQFELGLNLNVSYDPLTFIKQVKYITNSPNKQMFIDANYKINRQRTTEKHKDKRKYYKIYDKGWEMKEKKRRSPDSQNSNIKILRVETCFRRYNIIANKFFTDQNINRLAMRFYSDWKNLSFYCEITGRKGTRKSEIERAKILINDGAESYLEFTKNDFDNKKITENQYRTIREFIRDFDNIQSKFNIIISNQENEYKELLFSTFNGAHC